MENDIVAQIQKRMAELPENVRAAIQSNDLGERVRKIATLHQLHIDQMGKLEDEVILVMLGFSNPELFSKRLVEVLHIQSSTATELLADINSQIFVPIRETMKGGKAAAPKEAPTPTAPPLEAAELLLSQKTVSVAPPIVEKPAPGTSTPSKIPEASKPPTPQPYKADPYREPLQ